MMILPPGTHAKCRSRTNVPVDLEPARCGDHDNDYGSRDKNRFTPHYSVSITANPVGGARTALLLGRNKSPVNTK
jgi:hypothetical protein